jgi:hypothetical protein
MFYSEKQNKFAGTYEKQIVTKQTWLVKGARNKGEGGHMRH